MSIQDIYVVEYIDFIGDDAIVRTLSCNNEDDLAELLERVELDGSINIICVRHEPIN